MSGNPASDSLGSFQNPVYRSSFPDPFVLKHAGEYFAYATGTAADGRVFPVLRSRDLVEWADAGSAMDVLASAPPHYWAPEVTYDNGRFYLYYSCGNETTMHLRVAIAENPLGPFIDAGVELTPTDGFAIDAHVFTDEDGSRYMFYATDFLDHSHIGTGTVVDRMSSWVELAGDPRPVTRAMYDWQVYDPNRAEKGGVRWHTVEGPAVVKRKGKYFEMFSGGNWQNTSYGVSFAVSDTIDDPGEWRQFSDGSTVLPILRTIPDSVIGPGHNCIVRGPNNRELYCVYHRWTDAGRVMAIDRMDFAGDRIFIVGPTDDRQPAPFSPRTITAARSLGNWTPSNGGMISDRSSRSELTYDVSEDLICEITFRIDEWSDDGSAFGCSLVGASGPPFECRIMGNDLAGYALELNGRDGTTLLPLPIKITPASEHLLRVEASPVNASIYIDSLFAGSVELDRSRFEKLELVAVNASVELSAVEITDGFEDLFTSPAASADLAGWLPLGGIPTKAFVANGMLCLPADGDEIGLYRGAAFAFADYAATLKADASACSSFGLVLVADDGEAVCRFGCGPDGVFFTVGHREQTPLGPDKHDPGTFHHYRILRISGAVSCWIDGVKVFESAIADLRPACLGVFARECTVFADAARVMAIQLDE